MQKVLILGTKRPLLRDPIVASGFVEDGQGIDWNQPAATWKQPERAPYCCPLHAVSDGWQMVGAPVKDGWHSTDAANAMISTSFWAWHFVKVESFPVQHKRTRQ